MNATNSMTVRVCMCACAVLVCLCCMCCSCMLVRGCVHYTSVSVWAAGKGLYWFLDLFCRLDPSFSFPLIQLLNPTASKTWTTTTTNWKTMGYSANTRNGSDVTNKAKRAPPGGMTEERSATKWPLHTQNFLPRPECGPVQLARRE